MYRTMVDTGPYPIAIALGCRDFMESFFNPKDAKINNSCEPF